MAVENNSLMKALVQPDISPEKGRVDFETAMQKMEFTSVFDIIRLSQSEFAQRLMRYSDADPDLAYKNATRYAALIGRLYREYKTSSGKPQQSAQRTGILSLTSGPIYQNEFKEDWDSFVKVGAMAAIDSPVAYLAALWVFIKKLEATRHDPNDPIDPKRILLDKRRPDLKDLLITRENTFTPRPMLEIVNDALTRNLLNYLKGIEADKGKPIHQVLSERRFPFDLPYNFYHQQCQLGLADKKPGLGELNYWASLLLPIEQAASNHYGKVQTPARQAQLLLSGLSPQQQKLLIERSPFSNFYLTRSDLTDGWKSAGTTHLSPHNALRIAYLLPSGQDDIDKVDPAADKPDDVYDGTNNASVIFRKTGQSETKTLELAFNSMALNESARWNLNYLHENETRTIVSSIKATVPLPDPGPDTDGYTARFDLYTATGMSIDTPVKLAKQSFTVVQ
ncbi:Tc toxin subunit A [Pseudomonas fluorescens]|uniref:Tc toxin subunit A n=1 Tax=Pseudomonas fluorescens TaxID=294 RepID=UPI003D260B00